MDNTKNEEAEHKQNIYKALRQVTSSISKYRRWIGAQSTNPARVAKFWVAVFNERVSLSSEGWTWVSP